MVKPTIELSFIFMIILVIVVLIFLFSPLILGETKYRIKREVRLSGVTSSDQDLSEAIIKTKQFSETLVNEYLHQVKQEVNQRFRENFRLWKPEKLGVKVIFSKFSECLLYIYPAAENEIVVDSIDVPIQVAFLNGLIHLNEPKEPTDTRSIRLLIDTEEARVEYEQSPAQLINSGSGIRVGGQGSLRLKDMEKAIFFTKDTIFGFYNQFIEVDNTSTDFINRYGRSVSFTVKLAGPLLLTGEKDFSWAMEELKKLATQLVRNDIDSLIIQSEFFRQSRAHALIAPKAEEILQKKERHTNDPSFEYPLWEFKLDITNLQKEAEEVGIDTSYVNELLKYPSSSAINGHLMWYYPDLKGFNLQWITINLFLVFVLVFLLAAKGNGLQWWYILQNSLEAWPGKLFLGGLPITINAWIWSQKPPALTISYWIIPGLLLIISIVTSFMIGRHP